MAIKHILKNTAIEIVKVRNVSGSNRANGSGDGEKN